MIPEIYEEYTDVQIDSVRIWACTYVKLMSLQSSLSFVRRILCTSSVVVVFFAYFIIDHISVSYELITMRVVGDRNTFVFTRNWYFYNKRERAAQVKWTTKQYIGKCIIFIPSYWTWELYSTWFTMHSGAWKEHAYCQVNRWQDRENGGFES